MICVTVQRAVRRYAEATGKGDGLTRMEIEAISGAATIALASTAVFLLIAKAWAALSHRITRATVFSDQILHEAAHRFRNEFDRLTRSQSTYLSSALAFAVLFAAAYLLQAKDFFPGYPAWQINLQLTFVVLASAYVTYRLGRTVLARHQIKFVRDANIAIGHQLRQLPRGDTRVFHDVQTAAGIVDHVVVSQNGLYAIHVIARRPARDGNAKLKGNSIEFSAARLSNTDAIESVIGVTAKTRRLEKELGELLGHPTRIRAVLAVPGWDVTEQTGNEHLLVNERNVSIIEGWKDNKYFLMNEDVAAILEELTARCCSTA